MKNVAYFFLLSIELTKYVVSCFETAEVPFVFTHNHSKATFYSGSLGLPCDEIDLILKEDDDRLFDVLELDIGSTKKCPYKHLWKITSPNTFKRFARLTVLKFRGLILLPDDIQMKEKLESQLFNVPTITHFLYENCFIEGTRGKSVKWGFPPNISEFTIENCDIAHFHWEKPTTMNVLIMAEFLFNLHTRKMEKIPELGFPSLIVIDISYAPQINFTIPEIAFYCNMTTFIFDYRNMVKENPCKCELLKQWQRYLETVNFTLIIHRGGVIDDTFKNTECNATACANFDEPLNEANKRRASCLSLKPTPDAAAPTVHKKEFDSSRWSFWVFVLGGFLIVSLIFAIFMFAAQRLTKSSESELIGKEELEEAEDEAAEEEEE